MLKKCVFLNHNYFLPPDYRTLLSLRTHPHTHTHTHAHRPCATSPPTRPRPPPRQRTAHSPGRRSPRRVRSARAPRLWSPRPPRWRVRCAWTAVAWYCRRTKSSVDTAIVIFLFLSFFSLHSSASVSFLCLRVRLSECLSLFFHASFSHLSFFLTLHLSPFFCVLPLCFATHSNIFLFSLSPSIHHLLQRSVLSPRSLLFPCSTQPTHPGVSRRAPRPRDARRQAAGRAYCVRRV